MNIDFLLTRTTHDHKFLESDDGFLTLGDLLSVNLDHLEFIQEGDTVALIGDFEALHLANLIALISRNAIVVPLTNANKPQHPYFFEAANVDWVLEGRKLARRDNKVNSHVFVQELRKSAIPGLILFTSGSTGQPKAILHDMSKFLERFRTPRPTFVTLSFLLFDHIGGLNTFFHTLSNGGRIVSIKDRNPHNVIQTILQHGVELLPTTPTFLRLLLLSGEIERLKTCESLKVITWGTERMDKVTLESLCKELPNIDFRQTYGMSELGILRIKSKSRDSLFMKIGGEGIETRIVEQELQIRAENRMIGYLNSPSPFLENGWYPTGDLIEQDEEFIRIAGRKTRIVNVGGLKYNPTEIEDFVNQFDGVQFSKIEIHANPITGNHTSIGIAPNGKSEIDLNNIKKMLENQFPKHMHPLKYTLSGSEINYRFKRG